MSSHPGAVLAEEGGNFLVPNATFIAELVAFAIILWVLSKYVVPPVQRAMRERQEVIRGQIEESRLAREQLAKAEAEYQRALTEARAEAAKIRDSARADADRLREELRAQAHEEADRIRERSAEQLATQRQQVVNQLRAEIGRLAVTLAGRIVGESLEDDARRKRTVDRFLSELEQMAGSAPGPAAEAESVAEAGSGQPAPEPAGNPAGGTSGTATRRGRGKG
jgi:F-type H+-transporting ATPase subunit b